jgi:malate synthase
VAHPGLVPLAKYIFDTYMPFPNQVDKRTSSATTAADLVRTPDGTITQAGLALNLDVGLQYLTAWLGGNGCVPIYNLMEDAATAEICRAQVWQWIRHGAKLEDGRTVTRELVSEMLAGRAEESVAANLYKGMIFAEEFPEFLTLRAYDYLD